MHYQYHGDQRLYIYAPDLRNPNRLTRPSTKTMYTYLKECDAGRPRLMAQYGEGLYPVRRRAGRSYIIVGEAAEAQPQPPSPRPATIEAAVAEMVAKGKANMPGLAKRLESAAALVLDGLIQLAGEDAQVGPYTITAESCTCADFEYRGGWCKHRLGVRMARHLVANKFELPRPKPVETAPQISAKSLALIASDRVVDEERRNRLAYYESHHAAHTAALRRLGNGAKTLPADLARRAGIVNNREVTDGR